ncbi:tRNA 2-thiouridine(34) synthase MnmA [Histophilus somni]|uniref:tRNA 2-thiouridine(34) synthase MnmA n=1 Tax=Histophilus somni TaxID=731 RepID=UPI00094AA90D|nr:tRNA 2-thiouridine(34) synthase MnmA [Histophilus somni]
MKSIVYEKKLPKLTALEIAKNSKKKVICGMSGGVDSSVSAFILQQQGYQVEGLFMKNWEEDDDTDYCTAANDLADAQAVCDKLGIKLHKINFAAEYWDNVFEHFLAEYKAGRTPNPDILCNKEIKFKAFLEYAVEDLGADYIATGHYVRRSDVNGQTKLLRGLDSNKDQSYFLYTLSKDQVIQRVKGLSEDPFYVVEKDLINNVLVVAQGNDNSALLSQGLMATQLYWIDRLPIRQNLRCTVKTRYRQKDVDCEVIPINDDCIEVRFDEPQIAVTPGQSAVFYQGEVCLGGGVIERQIK